MHAAVPVRLLFAYSQYREMETSPEVQPVKLPQSMRHLAKHTLPLAMPIARPRVQLMTPLLRTESRQLTKDMPSRPALVRAWVILPPAVTVRISQLVANRFTPPQR